MYSISGLESRQQTKPIEHVYFECTSKIHSTVIHLMSEGYT
jgi:hypothetical protein